MKKNILFITRNGLLEPLGQSQILSYLKLLSKDFSISVISFEKAKEKENIEHFNTIKAICSKNNIQWEPLTYRQTLRSLGIILGLIELFLKVLNVCRKKQIDGIHARSYYPAFIALIIYKLKKIPFIFDMRALWPEELIEAGRLTKGSVPYKIIKRLEKKCLAQSSSVVSLTNAAVEHLNKIHPELLLKQKAIVIPTCADLDRFKLKQKKRDADKVKLSCIGSMLSGWFKVDVLRQVVDYLLTNYPSVSFEFLTRDKPEVLLNHLDPAKKWRARINIEAVLFEDMPDRLSSHDGSMFFFTADLSKLGSAPTRMAEILGTGIPVLANAGVGDVDKIILENNVGQLLDPNDPNNINQACDLFMNMLNQDGIAERCRATAEALFSLESGVIKYRSIYKDLPQN